MVAGPTKTSSGNVRVVARIRPLSSREKTSKEIMGSLDDRLVQVKGTEQRFFELDAVFGKDSTQQQVYERSGAREAVTQDLFSGFNCTVRIERACSGGALALVMISSFFLLDSGLWTDRSW